MFAFGPPRKTRRVSLTPMIDVVFLLLVFFMLTAQFGRMGSLPLHGAGQGDTYEGPPRLVSLDGAGLRLNGQPIPLAALADGLQPLMSAPDDLIVIEAGDGADTQALVDVMQALTTHGLTALAIVEAK